MQVELDDYGIDWSSATAARFEDWEDEITRVVVPEVPLFHSFHICKP